MAVLEVVKGSGTGQVIELTGEKVVFGRHPDSEIVLDNAAVSRHHAQILLNHGNYFLEDLRSRNRTHLNGVQIEGRTELHDSDEIKVCDFIFRFLQQIPADVEVVSPASSAVHLRSESQGNPAKQTVSMDDDHVLALDDEPGADDDRSSIITTLEATSSTHLRLSVNSEVKLRSILEISKSLGRVLELDDVLETILEALFKIFPQADEGFVMLKDAETGKLKIRTTRSRDALGDDSLSISMTIVRQAMDTREAILSANASSDSRFDASESLSNLRIRSIMCVPLLNNADEALGVIQLTTRDLRLQFSQDDLDLLTSVASQGSLAIDNANLHEAALKQRDLERDLEFATQVQRGILPNKQPDISSYEFADYYAAAQSVGGDYFDYVPLPDGRLAVTLADVAGKGVPAALLMARLYSSARYHLLTKTKVAEALDGLNGEIASSGLGHRFITYVMAIIDPVKHEITVANAGHLPPLRRDAKMKVTQVSQKSGMPLGIVATQEFREEKLPFKPGDTWLFYTDGVTEAMNSGKEIYGGERLEEFLSKGPAETDELIKGILADVDAFSEGLPQRDDMCLVAFRRVP